MRLAKLGDWVAGPTPKDVPDEVRHHAATLFANAAAVTVGGVAEAPVARAMAAARTLAPGEGSVRVIGSGTATSLEQATFIHGVAAHVQDFDDTELATIYHATASVFAGLASLAQVRDVDGHAALAAWTVGIEVGIRIAAALGMGHYDRGWHVTGTAGPAAVAAASARLLGLGPEATAQAIAIGATAASGHRAHFGTDTKSGHVGFAAQRGVHAALLAEAGFTAAPGALDGRRGLLEVIGPDGDPDALTRDLGTAWRVLGDRIKPYACGVVTHPAIDAGRELGVLVDHAPAEVTRVTLRVHPLVGELTGVRTPSTGLEAKFSVTHCFAVGLVLDRGDPSAFADEVVHDPRIVRARDLIDVVVDERVPHMTVQCDATVADGRTLAWTVDAARGSDIRPLTEDEVSDKVSRLLATRMAPRGAAAWFHRLRALSAEGSMRAMLLALDADLTVGRAPGSQSSQEG